MKQRSRHRLELRMERLVHVCHTALSPLCTLVGSLKRHAEHPGSTHLQPLAARWQGGGRDDGTCAAGMRGWGPWRPALKGLGLRSTCRVARCWHAPRARRGRAWPARAAAAPCTSGASSTPPAPAARPTATPASSVRACASPRHLETFVQQTHLPPCGRAPSAAWKPPVRRLTRSQAVRGMPLASLQQPCPVLMPLPIMLLLVREAGAFP